MLEQKKVTLEIAGIPMPSFVKLMLKQSINEHHYFEITLDIQAVEIYGVEIPNVSKDWIGKKVIMDFGGTIFIGIATMVGLHRAGGTHGNIKVTGYSSTFLRQECKLLSIRKRNRSWNTNASTRKPTSDSYNGLPANIRNGSITMDRTLFSGSHSPAQRPN